MTTNNTGSGSALDNLLNYTPVPSSYYNFPGASVTAATTTSGANPTNPFLYPTPAAPSVTAPIATSGATSSSTNSRNGGVNETYLKKILSCQPYTDEGGYELVTPFPWGRWKSLKEALDETHYGIVTETPTSQEARQITVVADTLLFAGVGTPNTVDPSSSLQSQLNDLSSISNQMADATTFEVVTPKPGDTQYNSLFNTQPDTNNLLSNQVKLNTDWSVNALLTGNVPPQPGSALALALNTTDKYTNTTLGIETMANTVVMQNNPFVVGGTAYQPTTQSQVFISKLINSNSTTM